MKLFYETIALICLCVSLSAFDYKGRANELQRLFLKEACKTYGLQVIAIGSGMPFDIQQLDLSFKAQGLYTVEQARSFYLPISESFLNFINSDKVLRPYLHDYPFKEKNIGFSIMFVDPKGNRPPSNYVAYVSLIKGHIFYACFDHQTKKLETIKQEPFEEAQKKVHTSVQ